MLARTLGHGLGAKRGRWPPKGYKSFLQSFVQSLPQSFVPSFMPNSTKFC